MEDNVIFHGGVFGEKLDYLFSKMNLGVACLALYRRNADIDTTLKLVEYMSRGIPCVSSSDTPEVMKYFPIIKVSNNLSPIDISDLYHKSKKFTKEFLNDTSSKAKLVFNWEYVLRNIINK